MEHLQEIRILRQRLEYSIKTNERLRKQLERQVTDKEVDQGKKSFNEKLNPPFLLRAWGIKCHWKGLEPLFSVAGVQHLWKPSSEVDLNFSQVASFH